MWVYKNSDRNMATWITMLLNDLKSHGLIKWIWMFSLGLALFITCSDADDIHYFTKRGWVRHYSIQLCMYYYNFMNYIVQTYIYSTFDRVVCIGWLVMISHIKALTLIQPPVCNSLIYGVVFSLSISNFPEFQIFVCRSHESWVMESLHQ